MGEKLVTMRPTVDIREIIGFIEAERLKENLTKKDFCKEIDISVQAYNNILKGASPNSELLSKMVDFFGSHEIGLVVKKKGK